MSTTTLKAKPANLIFLTRIDCVARVKTTDKVMRPCGLFADVLTSDGAFDDSIELTEWIKSRNGAAIRQLLSGDVRLIVDDAESIMRTDEVYAAVAQHLLKNKHVTYSLRIDSEELALWLSLNRPVGEFLN